MKLFAKFFVHHFKCDMEYKASFLLNCIGQFLVSFTVFAGIYFMFQRFSTVEGFSYSEVLLCFSIMLMEYSLAESLARGFDTFSGIVSHGEFDRILVRPRNEILLVLCNKIEFNRIGRMLQAAVMFVYGICQSNLAWTWDKVVVVILMLLGGTALFSGIFLIYAAICFFTIEGLEFMNILTDGAREYGKYPIGVYGRRLLQFSTFVVPYALVQYYPFLYLLGRGPRYYAFSPLFAFLFLIPAWGLWRFGVRHYKSSGS